ncbi:hypothetical protein [Pseudoduganella sp.]|uniref:hypothetical protein n=1 Tax=Pseudoduganella sp. TaxID=1880898 RepID=UPI0035B3973A
MINIELVVTLAIMLAAAWIMLLNIRGRRFLKTFSEASVSFDGSALQFEHYPFEPSTAYPNGVVCVGDIQSIELGHCSEIRLNNGDILFVPNSSKAALVEFVSHHNITLVKRMSVWSSLLEPFLDTTQTKEDIENELRWLAERGIDERSVRKWRSEVGRSMVALNFGTGLWEWTGFGLYDVLVAKRAFGRHSEFADFYRRAIALAALDAEYPSVGSMQWRDSMSGALHSVLLDWYPPVEKGSLATFTERWKARSERIEIIRDKLLEQLAVAYSDPQRLAQVDDALTELRRHFERAIRLNEVKWALIFLHAHDDAAQSAAWACRVMQELGRSTGEQEYVRALIMKQPNFSPDVALVHGLDGAPKLTQSLA